MNEMAKHCKPARSALRGGGSIRAVELCLALVLLAAGGGSSARANPLGMTVARGAVRTAQNGSQLNITASHNAVINWQSFNIAAGETTTFLQPSSVSVVWNQIFDRNPSQIWGSLNANGIVVLMNQNGFYFGPNSSVNVGGFIAAGAVVLPPPEMAGGMWTYQGPPPAASIINYGEIKTHVGGSLFMVAEKIENHGILSAPDGTLGLYAGKEVLISERPDGRGLSASVALPEGTINNLGQMTADAGAIALHAKVVNQNGLIQANSVRSRNGVIELVASDAVNLGPNSLIQANGDSSGASDGGQITIKSAGSFADDPASRIEVRGGAAGGNGGDVEISATTMPAIRSRIDGQAGKGGQGGTLRIDPDYITLSNDGTGTGGDPAGTLELSVRTDVNAGIYSPFYGLSQIDLRATHDISIAPNTVWDLNTSTGVSGSGSLLKLEAGNNIVFDYNAKITAGRGWSVTCRAGVDFSSPTLAVRSGSGGIYLGADPGAGDGGIETFDGNLTLEAGHEVMVGQGYARTIGGGSINVTTGDGNVDPGGLGNTYDFSVGDPYQFLLTGRRTPDIGGIGTAAGGSVTINAGGSIVSADNIATIGALGEGPGNVTLTAGGDITGHFLVRNGTGVALAEGNIGDESIGASFGLVGGSWTIKAGWDPASGTDRATSRVINGSGNINLDEIYNPNGANNANNSTQGAGVTYQYDYAPDARVDLMAGDSVRLLGDSLAGNVPGRAPIYAPILNIQSGKGGVTLGNDVVLFPSSQGSMTITTTDGGSLSSSAGNYFKFIESDSGSADYNDFVDGHAAIPTHLGETGYAMQLDISGDLRNVFLASPGASDIHIHGDAVNLSLLGQNLSAGEVTHLQIDGNYSRRANLTSVTLSDPADLSALTDPILSTDFSLWNRLSYDSTTHQLTLRGILTPVADPNSVDVNNLQPDSDLYNLLHPMVYVIDPATGLLKLGPDNRPITVPATFTTDTAAILKLYQDSQSASTSSLADFGVQLGGPGQLQISAQNIDLGISQGIRSVGLLNNPALVTVAHQGADIVIGTPQNPIGNLDITSSQIASFNGGSITINSSGHVDVGSQAALTSDSTPKGIYTGHGGDVTVHAAGDVLVNGSRIATYDGGNVTVISDNGQVDAGSGANGFFSLPTVQYDPATQQAVSSNDRFFGSGIIATTRVGSDARVGDITIQAHGDISADIGGVLQIPFNHADQSGSKVVLISSDGNIHAGNSGVLGHDVQADAPKGSIDGIFVATGNAEISAQQSVSVSLLAGGTANVSGSSVSGSVVGGGDVSVSGSEISASVISTGGSANSGGASAAGTAFAGVAAPAAQTTVQEADKTLASQSSSPADDEEEKKKRAKGPVLAKSVGRVTVILPKS